MLTKAPPKSVLTALALRAFGKLDLAYLMKKKTSIQHLLQIINKVNAVSAVSRRQCKMPFGRPMEGPNPPGTSHVQVGRGANGLQGRQKG